MDGPSAEEMGLKPEDLGIREKSLGGNDLPEDWPKIAAAEEEQKAYEALYKPGEDKSQPPTNQHIDKLSYTLQAGNKQLRYLAVQHIFGLENKNHPQFTALKASFDQQKPQVVLYEGPQGNPKSITEEEAYALGDKAFIQYLVQEHNNNLKPGEDPITMESCDLQPEDEPEEYRKKGFSNEEIVANEALKWMYYESQGIQNTPGQTNEQKAQRIQELQAKYATNPIASINPEFFSRVPRTDGKPWTADLVRKEIELQTGLALQVDFNYLALPRFKKMFDDAREFRDQYVVRKIAETLKQNDKVLTVMGSGHAIREEQALRQLFDQPEDLQKAA